MEVSHGTACEAFGRGQLLHAHIDWGMTQPMPVHLYHSTNNFGSLNIYRVTKFQQDGDKTVARRLWYLHCAALNPGYVVYQNAVDMMADVVDKVPAQLVGSFLWSQGLTLLALEPDLEEPMELYMAPLYSKLGSEHGIHQ